MYTYVVLLSIGSSAKTLKKNKNMFSYIPDFSPVTFIEHYFTLCLCHGNSVIFVCLFWVFFVVVFSKAVWKDINL